MEVQNSGKDVAKELQNEKDVAKELHKALREDTSNTNALTIDELYSIQLKSGQALISNKTFKEMGIKEELVARLYEEKLEKPSLIQSVAIPHILKGANVAFQSRSGTGKTIAFTLGILNSIEPGKGPQAIVLLPTRELSNQVGAVISKFGKALNVSVCVALSDFVGVSITEEIVLATPGKMTSLISRKILSADNIKIIVLDEADVLISQQVFMAPTMNLIRTLTKAQKVLFSATYSDSSKKAVDMMIPICDQFYEKNEKASKISLYYIEIDAKEKIATLKSLFMMLTIAQTIIFVSTKREVERIKNDMMSDGFSVSVIHGDMTTKERDDSFKDFYNAKTKILITTNVFSRGIDIPQVNLIINYDLPLTTYDDDPVSTYIHRVGRSGRFDRVGFVIDFISNKNDLDLMLDIDSKIGSVSKKFTIASLKDAFSES